MNPTSPHVKILKFLCPALATLVFANHIVADELVYIFKGNIAAAANDSHSQIDAGEGFVGVFTIDSSTVDLDSNVEVGFYADAILSGRIFFVGGHISADLAGSDIIVENRGSYDSIRVFTNEFTFFETRVEGVGPLSSDALPAAGLQFESAPDPATQFFDAFVYSDAGGIISHTSLQANDICFESKTGVPFANASGDPWYDVSSNWLAGFNAGPPTATDTVIFDRVSQGGSSVWWDSITGDRTCDNLCQNRGALFFDNRDGGNYTLFVNDTATINEPAQLILGDGTDTVNLDISNFLIVDGTLTVNELTSVESGFATDIDAGGFIVLSGMNASVNTGNGAMYVGINTQGTFVVREGAMSSDAGNPRVGAGNGGDGVVSVEDPGSQWNVDGSIDIGNIVGSIGLLNVQDGGLASANSNIRIGGLGSGSVILNNGSTVTAGNEITIHSGADARITGANVSLIQAPLICNMGLFEIDANIGADIDATVKNQGVIQSRGTSNNFIFADLIHDGTEVFSETNASIRINGAASGAGPYTGSGTVAFRGQCNPGTGDGIGITASIPMAGDLQLVSSSVFNIDIGGIGDFDQLAVDGDVSVDGAIAIDQVGGFIPGPNDKFPVIEVGGNRTGTFPGFPENAIVGMLGGVELRITYSGGDGNDIELYVGSGTLYGDVNLDGSINLLDVGPFVELISNGIYQIEGDVNMDGSVNLLDVGPFIDLISGN